VTRVPALAGALLLVTVRAVRAQATFRGYALNVAAATGASDWGPGSLSDLERVRLMAGASFAAVRFELADDQTIRYEQRATASLFGGSLGSLRASGDGVRLDGTILSNDHVLWRHRVDRLAASVSMRSVTITLGRQAISWGTTLLLTPADPFAPFDPSDPFREYRAGVDAARLQVFLGPTSQLDVVGRVSRTAGADYRTGLARASTATGGWELSGWGGVLYDRAAGAVGVTRTLGGWGARGELEVRNEPGRQAVVRGAIGADRRIGLWQRDLYIVLEYQHDGFGAARPGALTAVALSRPFARGELQLLGRDDAVAQLSYQVHPLVSAELLTLWSLRDGSALVAPGVTVSVTDEIGARAGFYLPLGNSAVRGGLLPTPASEFGTVPRFGYISASLFF
jgi:hypothetical protein